MKILWSKTGSSGNCSVIESSSGNLLTIDAGIKYEVVNRSCEYRLHECKNVLLTHGHKDHSLYASYFCKRGMNIYAGEEASTHIDVNVNSLKLLKPAIQFDMDGFRAIPIEMTHSNSDGTACECFGFLIQDTCSKEKMLWVTDSQFIQYKFPPLDYYCIEGNYWEQESYLEELDAIEKNVEMRRVKSHMSIQTAVDFLKQQDLSKCKEIRFLHMSNSMTKEERDKIVPYVLGELEKVGRSDLNVIF